MTISNLRQGKTHFNFDLINKETPITQDPAFNWFLGQNLKQGSDIDHICNYLDFIGMNIKIHYVEDYQIERLQAIFEGAYRNWLPCLNESFTASQLFTLTDQSVGNYDNQNEMVNAFNINSFSFKNQLKDGVYKISDRLIDFINKQGCIMAINYFNIYFRIDTNNSGETFLYYSYQQILGGRRLCKINKAEA